MRIYLFELFAYPRRQVHETEAKITSLATTAEPDTSFRSLHRLFVLHDLVFELWQIQDWSYTSYLPRTSSFSSLSSWVIRLCYTVYYNYVCQGGIYIEYFCLFLVFLINETAYSCSVILFSVVCLHIFTLIIQWTICFMISFKHWLTHS